MINDNAFATLLAFMLPKDINENFELFDVTDELFEGSPALHLHLEERPVPPKESPKAIPNGFYKESVVTDFPMRDKVVVLHIRRRRWKDSEGRSLPAKDIPLAAKGTRISCEFAAFLKDVLGLEPDNDGVAG